MMFMFIQYVYARIHGYKAVLSQSYTTVVGAKIKLGQICNDTLTLNINCIDHPDKDECLWDIMK